MPTNSSQQYQDMPQEGIASPLCFDDDENVVLDAEESMYQVARQFAISHGYGLVEFHPHPPLEIPPNLLHRAQRQAASGRLRGFPWETRQQASAKLRLHSDAYTGDRKLAVSEYRAGGLNPRRLRATQCDLTSRVRASLFPQVFIPTSNDSKDSFQSIASPKKSQDSVSNSKASSPKQTTSPQKLNSPKRAGFQQKLASPQRALLHQRMQSQKRHSSKPIRSAMFDFDSTQREVDVTAEGPLNAPVCGWAAESHLHNLTGRRESCEDAIIRSSSLKEFQQLLANKMKRIEDNGAKTIGTMASSVDQKEVDLEEQQREASASILERAIDRMWTPAKRKRLKNNNAISSPEADTSLNGEDKEVPLVMSSCEGSFSQSRSENGDGRRWDIKKAARREYRLANSLSAAIYRERLQESLRKGQSQDLSAITSKQIVEIAKYCQNESEDNNGKEGVSDEQADENDESHKECASEHEYDFHQNDSSTPSKMVRNGAHRKETRLFTKPCGGEIRTISCPNLKDGNLVHEQRSRKSIGSTTYKHVRCQSFAQRRPTNSLPATGDNEHVTALCSAADCGAKVKARGEGQDTLLESALTPPNVTTSLVSGAVLTPKQRSPSRRMHSFSMLQPSTARALNLNGPHHVCNEDLEQASEIQKEEKEDVEQDKEINPRKMDGNSEGNWNNNALPKVSSPEEELGPAHCGIAEISLSQNNSADMATCDAKIYLPPLRGNWYTNNANKPSQRDSTRMHNNCSEQHKVKEQSSNNTISNLSPVRIEREKWANKSGLAKEKTSLTQSDKVPCSIELNLTDVTRTKAASPESLAIHDVHGEGHPAPLQQLSSETLSLPPLIGNSGSFHRAPKPRRNNDTGASHKNPGNPARRLPDQQGKCLKRQMLISGSSTTKPTSNGYVHIPLPTPSAFSPAFYRKRVDSEETRIHLDVDAKPSESDNIHHLPNNNPQHKYQHANLKKKMTNDLPFQSYSQTHGAQTKSQLQKNSDKEPKPSSSYTVSTGGDLSNLANENLKVTVDTNNSSLYLGAPSSWNSTSNDQPSFMREKNWQSSSQCVGSASSQSGIDLLEDNFNENLRRYKQNFTPDCASSSETSFLQKINAVEREICFLARRESHKLGLSRRGRSCDKLLNNNDFSDSNTSHVTCLGIDATNNTGLNRLQFVQRGISGSIISPKHSSKGMPRCLDRHNQRSTCSSAAVTTLKRGRAHSAPAMQQDPWLVVDRHAGRKTLNDQKATSSFQDGNDGPYAPQCWTTDAGGRCQKGSDSLPLGFMLQNDTPVKEGQYPNYAFLEHHNRTSPPILTTSDNKDEIETDMELEQNSHPDPHQDVSENNLADTGVDSVGYLGQINEQLRQSHDTMQSRLTNIGQQFLSQLTKFKDSVSNCFAENNSISSSDHFCDDYKLDLQQEDFKAMSNTVPTFKSDTPTYFGGDMPVCSHQKLHNVSSSEDAQNKSQLRLPNPRIGFCRSDNVPYGFPCAQLKCERPQRSPATSVFKESKKTPYCGTGGKCSCSVLEVSASDESSSTLDHQNNSSGQDSLLCNVLGVSPLVPVDGKKRFHPKKSYGGRSCPNVTTQRRRRIESRNTRCVHSRNCRLRQFRGESCCHQALPHMLASATKENKGKIRKKKKKKIVRFLLSSKPKACKTSRKKARGYSKRSKLRAKRGGKGIVRKRRNRTSNAESSYTSKLGYKVDNLQLPNTCNSKATVYAKIGHRRGQNARYRLTAAGYRALYSQLRQRHALLQRKVQAMGYRLPHDDPMILSQSDIDVMVRQFKSLVKQCAPTRLSRMRRALLSMDSPLVSNCHAAAAMAVSDRSPDKVCPRTSSTSPTSSRSKPSESIQNVSPNHTMCFSNDCIRGQQNFPIHLSGGTGQETLKTNVIEHGSEIQPGAEQSLSSHEKFRLRPVDSMITNKKLLLNKHSNQISTVSPTCSFCKNIRQMGCANSLRWRVNSSKSENSSQAGSDGSISTSTSLSGKNFPNANHSGSTMKHTCSRRQYDTSSRESFRFRRRKALVFDLGHSSQKDVLTEAVSKNRSEFSQVTEGFSITRSSESSSLDCIRPRSPAESHVTKNQKKGRSSKEVNETVRRSLSEFSISSSVSSGQPSKKSMKDAKVGAVYPDVHGSHREESCEKYMGNDSQRVGKSFIRLDLASDDKKFLGNTKQLNEYEKRCGIRSEHPCVDVHLYQSTEMGTNNNKTRHFKPSNIWSGFSELLTCSKTKEMASLCYNDEDDFSQKATKQQKPLMFSKNSSSQHREENGGVNSSGGGSKESAWSTVPSTTWPTLTLRYKNKPKNPGLTVCWLKSLNTETSKIECRTPNMNTKTEQMDITSNQDRHDTENPTKDINIQALQRELPQSLPNRDAFSPKQQHNTRACFPKLCQATDPQRAGQAPASRPNERWEHEQSYLVVKPPGISTIWTCVIPTTTTTTTSSSIQQSEFVCPQPKVSKSHSMVSGEHADYQMRVKETDSRIIGVLEKNEITNPDNAASATGHCCFGRNCSSFSSGGARLRQFQVLQMEDQTSRDMFCNAKTTEQQRNDVKEENKSENAKSISTNINSSFNEFNVDRIKVFQDKRNESLEHIVHKNAHTSELSMAGTSQSLTTNRVDLPFNPLAKSCKQSKTCNHVKTRVIDMLSPSCSKEPQKVFNIKNFIRVESNNNALELPPIQDRGHSMKITRRSQKHSSRHTLRHCSLLPVVPTTCRSVCRLRRSCRISKSLRHGNHEDSCSSQLDPSKLAKEALVKQGRVCNSIGLRPSRELGTDIRLPMPLTNQPFRVLYSSTSSTSDEIAAVNLSRRKRKPSETLFPLIDSKRRRNGTVSRPLCSMEKRMRFLRLQVRREKRLGKGEYCFQKFRGWTRPEHPWRPGVGRITSVSAGSADADDEASS